MALQLLVNWSPESTLIERKTREKNDAEDEGTGKEGGQDRLVAELVTGLVCVPSEQWPSLRPPTRDITEVTQFLEVLSGCHNRFPNCWCDFIVKIIVVLVSLIALRE